MDSAMRRRKGSNRWKKVPRRMVLIRMLCFAALKTGPDLRAYLISFCPRGNSVPHLPLPLVLV